MEQNELNKYKFTTNILTEARHRTKYVDALKKITIDAQVSFSRLIISLVLLAILIIITIFYITNDFYRAKFVIFPTIMLFIGILILLLNYMLPARGKSMLIVASSMLISLFTENLRRKAKRNGDIKSVGISKVKNGIFYFENGNVGVMFKVEGHLSPSVLPQVADLAAQKYSQYLIARRVTTAEKLITSVREVDVRNQLKSYLKVNEEAHENIDTAMGQFNAYMSKMYYDYVKDYMENQEYTISQLKIIQEPDIDGLKKAIAHFQTSDIYAYYEHVKNQSQIVEYLAPLTLLSKKGQELNSKVEEDPNAPRRN